MTAHEIIYRSAGWSALALGILSVAAPIAPLIGDMWPPTWPLTESVYWCCAKGWWLGPVFGAIAGALLVIRRVLGPPFAHEALAELLEMIRREAFGTASGDLDRHRVRLFRAIKSKRDWRRWLQWPFCYRKLRWVATTGMTDHAAPPHFCIPKAKDRAQGVAGRAWHRNGTLTVGDLPDTAATAVTKRQIQDYANRTWCHYEWVDKRRPISRWLCAWTVKARGRRWGVIVLDSSDPSPVVGDVEQIYLNTEALLAVVLEQL